MRRALLLLAAVTLVATPLAAQKPDSASYVTRLGRDTLALERFVVRADRLDAEVVLRSPRTRYGRYTLRFDAAGRMTSYEAAVWDGPWAQGAPETRETVRRRGNEFDYERTGGRAFSITLVSDTPLLPFIDMVHWPFELMLRREYRTLDGETSQALFSGGRVLPFGLIRRGPNRFGVRHPTRGTMDVTTDDQGRLLGLDARETTRALTVQRSSWIELRPLAEDFAARDAAGGGLGALSGRGEEEATVHGAHITVDYGTPRKRGRKIFGGLLDWGTLWRTGANRATHFATDRDLTLGTLEVPAGTYTLFTIPEPDGGVLIVNTETGQTGTAYAEELDLGRVPMAHTTGDEVVETFTIRVRELDEGGVLELLWDRDVFSVPFRVR